MSCAIEWERIEQNASPQYIYQTMLLRPLLPKLTHRK